MKLLEVCTVSSSAYALVFQRAHALNQRYPGKLQVDILCTPGKEVALMRQQGMNVIETTLHRSLNPLQLLRSAWHLQRALRGYDAVHLHFGVPGLVGRALAFFNRDMVWIYQSHGYSIAENTSPLAKRAYLWIEKILKHSVRYSLFQLREDMELARQHRLLDETQMVYLGNGVDLDKFSPVATPAQVITVFGMVARFEPIKNHALLLAAIQLLAQKTRAFKVRLIGQGHLQNDIAQTIQQANVADIVEIVPYDNDMPQFYRSIDVGVLTSFAEGIPRALIEPMACGKPVICTDVKGSREAIIDQQTGFKTPINDPQTLASHMLWLIEHPEQRQQMGQAARQHALQHFSEARIIQSLGELYLACDPHHTSVLPINSREKHA